jgi:hypothetical protein
MAKTDANTFDPVSDIRDVSVSNNMLSIGTVQFRRNVSIPLLDALEELAKNYPISPVQKEWVLDITTDFDYNIVYAKNKALAGFCYYHLYWRLGCK